MCSLYELSRQAKLLNFFEFSSGHGQVDLAETNENENGKGRQGCTFYGIGRRSYNFIGCPTEKVEVCKTNSSRWFRVDPS